MTDRQVIAPKGSKCAACGAPLGFYKNERGNWCPCNPDGSDHWDLCRERRYALAKTGEHVSNEREEAYYRTDKETGEIVRFAIRESAKVDERKQGGLVTECHCDIPPWDDPCPTCPAAI